MDVWEFDLLDIQVYAKHNDDYKYILSVIDIFSKFLFLVPVKAKSSPAVTTAFLSIFDYDRKKLRGDTYGYARLRSRNFSINIFWTCYATTAYSFGCAETPT